MISGWIDIGITPDWPCLAARGRASPGVSAQGGGDVVWVAVEIQCGVAPDAHCDGGEPVAGTAHAASLLDSGGEAVIDRRVPAAVGLKVVAGPCARSGEVLLGPDLIAVDRAAGHLSAAD